MARAIAELAPRNAVVGLEGAVRDLSERVEALRRNGHAEQLLAPLDAMAGELRIALKAYDSRSRGGWVYEREIPAIGGKIDGLAETAVKPETFEADPTSDRGGQFPPDRCVQSHAAVRPAGATDRGELADRIEKLNVSGTAPQIESAQTAAALAELRREVERAAPATALAPDRTPARADRRSASTRRVAPRPQEPLETPSPSRTLTGASTACASRGGEAHAAGP